MLDSLRWRLIGPHRGGRVVAVAGHPTDPLVFYFGACSGGVWKTVDGGNSWDNVSDGFFRTAPVGALAVAEADPNVVYAGMGEACLRGNVSHGDGVYRTTDGGKTWTHRGLAETRHIGRVRVHPQDPDLVYVAALGHAFGPNPERGVYRSRDGGATWDLVLHRGPRAGAIDLCLDPSNPRVLYAATYEVQRGPHFFNGGGEGSGLFKSTDGGDTWTELTGCPGMPEGVKGRIGVTVAATRPERVWAIVEAAEGGLFRSDDGGATWERTSGDQEIRQRAWYYSHVFADPCDADTVWALNVRCLKSTDAGRTWTKVPTPHGDNHDLWMDPRDSRRMIEGNDGGACVSLDGGASWSTVYNQPTAQFYHVTTDTRFPYRVYGAQQDNSTLSVPSRSDDGAISFGDCYPVGGGESGYIAVRPDDPDVVFAGSYSVVTRYDHRTHQSQNVLPWPENPMGWGAKDLKYRFQWTFPIMISPHDPDVLYCAAQHVFRSRDGGASWDVVSPDLTRNDPSRMEPTGGPITKDNTSVEYYCTVFALAESPVAKGVLWAGSDDGRVHVSRDGGQSWTDVTPPELPEWAMISLIEASPHQAGTAYLAATRYKLDDFRPYLYRTEDYGQSWHAIVGGIPAGDFTRAIRADPERAGLLFAGTETGVYVSFDDGAAWSRLQANLPVVPVHDLAIRGQDLIAATHGRSFWILGDLGVLRQWSPEVGAAPAHLFAPGRTLRLRAGGRGFRDPSVRSGYMGNVRYRLTRNEAGQDEMSFVDAGSNPPVGVVVHYHLKERPEGEVTLAFLDAEGNLVREFSSRKAAAPEGVEAPGAAGHGAGAGEPKVPAAAGLNRFVWNMRYPDAHGVPGAIFWQGGVTGPVAAPGSYQVRLRVGGLELTQPLQIAKDPRIPAGDDDLRQQFDLLLRIREKLSETHDAINDLRSVRQQVDDWVRRAAGTPAAARLEAAAGSLKGKLLAVEEELIQFRSKAHEDPLNFPIKLNNKLASLSGAVASADAAPTTQARAVFSDVSARIDGQLAALKGILGDEVAAFERLVAGADLPAIVLKSRT